MSSVLHFPDAATMIQYLSNHPLLSMKCNQEKGITKAVAELAAARFADSDKSEMDVKMGTRLLINDLRTGEDRFTGKALPDLVKLGLPPKFWVQISMATQLALTHCANSVKV